MRKALGRGLDALLPPPPSESAVAPIAGTGVLRVPLAKIRPNHLQPRRHFDPQALSELAASIKLHGLAQPLIVTPDGDGTYELIAGERRLRACELAGLREVEVIVRQSPTEKERLAVALIENLQREDLNAIETGLGYLRLMKEFEVNQTELGELIGKSKQAISNTLRLLELPEDVQKAIQFGELTEGHGRALLMVRDAARRHELFLLALDRKLSVRELEDLARDANATPEAPSRAIAEIPAKPADLKALEAALQQRLGTKVAIKTRKDPSKGGTITIHFYSLDDFDRLVLAIK